jgi:AcrR family transcriptional regulator
MTGTGVRRAQRAETEAALKGAAVRVFERVGYLNAKITDITAEAGRAAGSFYTHFANKEALLEALLADLLAGGDDLAADPEHSSDFSVRAAVRYHVASYWRFFREHYAVMVALQQAATVDERFAQRMREMLVPDLRHLAEHLERARDAGVRLPGEPLLVAAVVRGAFTQLAQFLLIEGGPGLDREVSDEEAIETVTSFVFAGIGAIR